MYIAIILFKSNQSSNKEDNGMGKKDMAAKAFFSRPEIIADLCNCIILGEGAITLYFRRGLSPYMRCHCAFYWKNRGIVVRSYGVARAGMTRTSSLRPQQAAFEYPRAPQAFHLHRGGYTLLD